MNFGAAAEVDAFPDDHLRHAKLNRSPAAKMAGHQRRVKHGITVGFLPPGVGEAVDLRMGHRIAALDSAVMAAADDLTGPDQDGADRQPSLAKPRLGFSNRRQQKRIAVFRGQMRKRFGGLFWFGHDWSGPLV